MREGGDSGDTPFCREYDLFFPEENPIVSEQAHPAAPLRRIITHAAPCATTVEAETTELIEDIVYRYFSTLCERVGRASTICDNTSTSSCLPRWCKGPYATRTSRFSSVINLPENDDHPHQFTEV